MNNGPHADFAKQFGVQAF